MRQVQLRDSDALFFLNNRDYEVISLCFSKFTTKLKLDQFGYNQVQLVRSHSYRKYNPAYFEEILINSEVDQRVAKNYEEKFIVKPEEVFVTFEMFCDKDYDRQFLATPKTGITEPQFLDLFLRCLRNDSFKILFLIYTLYLDKDKCIDSRVMELVIRSIKRSVQHHEAKLFFIHEHFNLLSVEQLNQLIQVYQVLLLDTPVEKHLMVSQYNPIKVSLLIYRICWQIEQRRIYSLVAKCKVLQEYLLKSLLKYFDHNSNILKLRKFMLEPCMGLSGGMDCFDLIYQMQLQIIMGHSTVIEVVDMINQGEYSISQSALTVSQTYLVFSSMNVIDKRSITNRLLTQIMHLGTDNQAQKSSLLYNIWRHSIDQRGTDEMVITLVLNLALTAIIMITNNNLVYSFRLKVEHLGGGYFTNPTTLERATAQQKATFCKLRLEVLDQDQA